MTTGYVVITLVGLLIALEPAIAADRTPLQRETKICRASETRTGTRIRTGRKCRTAEEWQKEDEERARIPLSLTVTEGQPEGPARPRPQ